MNKLQHNRLPGWRRHVAVGLVGALGFAGVSGGLTACTSSKNASPKCASKAETITPSQSNGRSAVDLGLAILQEYKANRAKTLPAGSANHVIVSNDVSLNEFTVTDWLCGGSTSITAIVYAGELLPGSTADNIIKSTSPLHGINHVFVTQGGPNEVDWSVRFETASAPNWATTIANGNTIKTFKESTNGVGLDKYRVAIALGFAGLGTQQPLAPLI